jgi:hypothetical protein
LEALVVEESGVESVTAQELGVGALFGNSAVVENEDALGSLQGGDPVGNEHNGAPWGDLPEGGTDGVLGCAVNRGESIVEHEDRAFPEQCAGKGYSLFLPAGERDAPLTDERVPLINRQLCGPISMARLCAAGMVATDACELCMIYRS